MKNVGPDPAEPAATPAGDSLNRPLYMPIETMNPPAAFHASPTTVDSATVETWQPTRPTGPQTLVLQDADDYLAPLRHDIGRLVGDNLRELFVSCDPAPAMVQQFELLHPDFIAVHDIGTQSSRRLLAGVAAKTRRPLQQLVIRRQGYGTPLASLEFVEFGDEANGSLRLYTTATDADSISRHSLARVLLAHSRLAVVLVGDLPAHALTQALQPIQGDIASGAWINGQLLLLPLAASATIASLGSQLGRIGRRDGSVGSGVTVRTTPQVTSPAEAWNFLGGTWNQLRDQLAAQGTLLPGLGPGNAIRAVTAAAAAPRPRSITTQPPAPTPPVAVPAHQPGEELNDYVLRMTQINGVLASCVFDAASGASLAHSGSTWRAADLAREGATLLQALVAAGSRLALEPTAASTALPTPLPEAVVTFGAHHLVVRPLPQRPGLVLHAVLDRSQANITLARLQIARLDAVLDGAAR